MLKLASCTHDAGKVPEIPKVLEVIVALAQLERTACLSLPAANHIRENRVSLALTLCRLNPHVALQSVTASGDPAHQLTTDQPPGAPIPFVLGGAACPG